MVKVIGGGGEEEVVRIRELGLMLWIHAGQQYNFIPHNLLQKCFN